VSQVSLDLPNLGEVNATADPKVRSALQALAAAINGGLDSSNVTDASLQLTDLATLVQQMLVPTGAMTAYAGATAPAGWLLCDGSAVSRTTFSALFSVLGTTFGVGDGSTTFNLPDLRGRVPVGEDGAAGRLSANDVRGNVGGEEKHTLTVGELPAGLDVWNEMGVGTASPLSLGDGYYNPRHGAVGSSTPHNNMQPYQVTNWLVKT
jgi:microcystin-dependent protein